MIGLARHRVAVVIALAAAVMSAGCGDEDASGGDSSSVKEAAASSTSPEPVDPMAAEREAVVAAYEDAVHAASRALAPPIPDPEHPDLLATHTGPMLEQRQMVAEGLAAKGWAIRLPQDTRFRVEADAESVEFAPGDPDVAFLTACSVDDGERFVVATGEPVADGGGLLTIEFSVAMQRVDGVWKLAERRAENRWEGEAGCALD